MITLLLSSILGAVPSSPVHGAFAPGVEAQEGAGIDARIAAAGSDVAKLIELATACASSGDRTDAEQVYRRVLALDKDNKAAREGLRHQFYDGRWFESLVELVAYKRKEDASMKAKGLARWKDGWVPDGDVPFLRMEWTKDARGVWTHPLDAAHREQVEEWMAAGYQFRADDNSWVAPDDVGKWQALQWKCGDAWVDTAKADEFHSRIEQRWELAGEHYLVLSTCAWEVANLARWHADQAHVELVRCFGVEPGRKPTIFVLNGLAQYNQAAGNQGTLVESEANSSLHGAYFADCCFDLTLKPPRHLACGVSFWDQADARLAPWGPAWARWAAAQSFVDAIDPSWGAVSNWIAVRGRDDIENYKGPFWGEKKIPRWLRWGVATYVERLMRDFAAPAGADPWGLRSWTFGEIKRAGGLLPLADIFAFKRDFSDVAGANRLSDGAGLLVAYLLDGSDRDLGVAHEAFKVALKSGKGSEVAAAATALQQALAARESAIKAFAGL